MLLTASWWKRCWSNIQGIAEVKSYNLTGEKSKDSESAIDEKHSSKHKIGDYPLSPIMFLQSLTAKLIGVVIAGVSVAFYLNGTMELLNAVVMVIAAFILFGALDSAGSYSALLRNVDLNVSKANSVLDMPTMDIDGKDITPDSYDIDVENVEFSYDKRKTIDGISVHIPQKTSTAIVGPSGGGKTTLCHLIARFWDVDKGCVSLGGVDVKEYSMDSLMRNFSFVFQKRLSVPGHHCQQYPFRSAGCTDGKGYRSSEKSLLSRFHHGTTRWV